jgi:streptomycin 6-kinase
MIHMTKYYSFQPEEIENITKRFGEDFYQKVCKDIEHYRDKLNLTSIELIPSYSANLVFKCHSPKLGSAILKIGNTRFREIVTEINALSEYNGRGFCKVFVTDAENGVILEERVLPGSTLRNEVSLERRLSVFASLYSHLHIPPAKAEQYPTYQDWVSRITAYMSSRQDCKEFYSYMKKAEDICRSVSNLYTQQMLLHGDFHHDNILLGSDGKYIIIDPKGVIGDPVLDVPRFILNEFDEQITNETYQKIKHIIYVLGKSLSIPIDILKKCLYVETVMDMCWCIQDGAIPEKDSSLRKTVELVEALLNS